MAMAEQSLKMTSTTTSELASTLGTESNMTTPSSSISKPEPSEFQRQELSPEEQRRVMRKIDMRVCVVLAAINCISLLDRTNLGLAVVAGMSQDLRLDMGDRYRIAALIFFVPYLLFELPGTVFVRKSGARPLLMSLCTFWGVLVLGTGFVNSWQQVVWVRVLLGVFESVYNPVIVFLLSSWYTRYEMQKRFAALLIITVVVSSLSGILAFGLWRMEGLGNLRGWRWTFIIEGILTVLIGLVCGFLVVDFPDKARGTFRFLTDAQIDWVMQRLRDDRDDVDEEAFTWKKFFSGGRHFAVWLYAIMECACIAIVSCVSFFLPLILNRDMGFEQGKALLLTSPPYLFSAIPVSAAAWLGDKYRVRGPIIMFNSLVAVVGLVLLGWIESSSVRYFSLFLINGGVLSNVPTILTYQANNVCGQWMRAFSSATLVIGAGLGGVLGSLIFNNSSKASSLGGIGICIALNVLTFSIALGLMVFYMHRNRLAKQGHRLIFNRPGFLYSV